MDPVTHTLTGVVAAHAFFRKRLGPVAVPILAVASNLPDVDAVMHLVAGPAALPLRRTFGHSIFTIPLWALALALVLSRFRTGLRFRTLYGLAILGCAIHLVFDLVNSYGVVVLWPFSDWRPELAIVFIIDLILTGLLLAPLVLAIPKSARPRLRTLSRGSVVAVAAYLAVCGGLRGSAVRALERDSAARGAAPALSYVFPEPLGPHRWRGVTREGDVYRLSLIHAPGGRVDNKDEVRTADSDPRAAEARGSPIGRRLEGFFKAPVWTVEPLPLPGGAAGGDPALVRVSDLRFRSLVLDRPAIFEYVFRVGNGTVEVTSW